MKLKNKKRILETIPFDVEELTFSDPETDKSFSHPYHRLNCPDWVNVLPITKEGQAILIRQFRAGALDTILETPGGVVDPNEHNPEAAAIRELEEETGYVCNQLIHLTSLNPNPATHDNLLHCYLALGCHLPEKREHFPDENENISLEFVDQSRLEGLLYESKVNHALSALTISMALRVITEA